MKRPTLFASLAVLALFLGCDSGTVPIPDTPPTAAPASTPPGAKKAEPGNLASPKLLD